MPAYKDKKKGTWTAAFYYQDWTGERKKKYKRGFKTKRDAAEYESEFKLGASGDMDMTMESFMKVYFRDKQGELKERSMTSKKYMMDAHIVPYFKGRKLNAITPADIIKWQNAIRDKGYSQTYLRMIQNQLTALFTHAHNIYDLSNNPCKKVKKMGKADGEKVDFWTYDEYERFIGTMDEDSRHYVIFETLFWTGCRIGELLALTKNDVDFNNNQIHISKTYYRHNCKDVITTPKTEQSIRTIDIPEFLKEEIQSYYEKMFEYPADQRLFPIMPEAIQHKLKRNVEKAGVKKIRVHDLRHSHVAYLIYQGVQPLVIKERVGHRDIGITMNTYGHLYPSEQKSVAVMLERNKLEVKEREQNKSKNVPAKHKDISR